MKAIQMHVYVCDEDGVAFQARIVATPSKRAEVQLGLLDNIDALSGASLLLIVAHAMLASPADLPEMAGEVEATLMQCQALLKARTQREKSERRHSSKRPARSEPGFTDDDSEIPF